jgi:hypothetical protein
VYQGSLSYRTIFAAGFPYLVITTSSISEKVTYLPTFTLSSDKVTNTTNTPLYCLLLIFYQIGAVLSMIYLAFRPFWALFERSRLSACHFTFARGGGRDTNTNLFERCVL